LNLLYFRLLIIGHAQVLFDYWVRDRVSTVELDEQLLEASQLIWGKELDHFVIVFGVDGFAFGASLL
jgi:hypothetical protein